MVANFHFKEVAWGELSMDWELSTRVLGWTTSGSCPMDWELSTFLDTIFRSKIEKIRRLWRNIANLWSFMVFLYGLGVVQFQGFLGKIFGQLWELSGQLPPGYPRSSQGGWGVAEN